MRKFDFEKYPIVEIVNEIILDAAKMDASDIHFDPGEDDLKVRVRVDGLLTDYTVVPNTLKNNLVTRIKIIASMNITENRLPQDGAIKTSLAGINLDLRVSCLPTNLGEKIVIRILDYSMSLKGLEHLGLSESNYNKIVEMIASPSGIILVTGATGSGKSTTVYSILQRLNTEDTNVITVEDPVEMNVEGINQVQTNSEIGLDFASALRSILRQDPNIIMIGEIRDTETAKIAVRASITGHLVLSTLHTNSSLTTIERLLDMQVERYLLSSSLNGIVSQKLARRLCDNCKHTRAASAYEKEMFKKVLDIDINEITVPNLDGCTECGHGYKGRMAIHEVLLINSSIKDAISDGVKKDQLRDLVYSSDITTLLQDGLEKVLAGYTSFEEVLKLIELEEEVNNTNIQHEEKRSGLESAISQSNIKAKTATTDYNNTASYNTNDFNQSNLNNTASYNTPNIYQQQPEQTYQQPEQHYQNTTNQTSNWQSEFDISIDPDDDNDDFYSGF